MHHKINNEACFNVFDVHVTCIIAEWFHFISMFSFERWLTLFYSGDDGGKVVIKQDHVSGLLGHVRARDSHGNTDVGLLQGGGVVHTITCHSYDGTLRGTITRAH